MTEVERGRLVVLRIVVVTVGIAVAWLAGWRTGATMGVVVLATYIATLALPRTSPLRVAAGGFGILYLGFGAFMLVGALITWRRGGPGSAPLAITLLLLGVVLTPVAVLFLRELVRATPPADSSDNEQSSV